MTRKWQFGVSSHLYHNTRLCREHLLEVGAAGFEAFELFATRTHFDYHNEASVADLQQWLAEAGLVLHGVHAPIGESYANGRWGPRLNLASADAGAREHAMAEAERALHVGRRIPFQVFVVHLGLPRHEQAPGSATRDAARRSVEALLEIAAPLGVRVAVEVIPNELSRAGAVVHFVEDVLEREGAGICLDVGHAHMDGEVVDAIETVAEHLITTHVHDNRGRSDDHLVPFEGSIDWAAAMTAVQKVGYDGRLLFEVGAQGPAKETLQRAARARDRMERLLATDDDYGAMML